MTETGTKQQEKGGRLSLLYLLLWVILPVAVVVYSNKATQTGYGTIPTD